MKATPRNLTAAALLLIVAAACYWTWTGSRNLPSGSQSAKPAVTGQSETTSPPQAPAAALDSTVTSQPLQDRFAHCPVIARKQDTRTEHGTLKTYRYRLVRDDSFQYPFIRVEDILTRTPDGDQLTRQTAMVGDHVMVKPRDPDLDPTQLLEQLRDTGATLRARMPGTGIWLIAFPSPDLETVQQAITRLATLNRWVSLAEADYLINATVTPNDPSFSSQWNLRNTGQNGGLPNADILATDAWTFTTGSSSVVVAVIDSGIDMTHPDLKDSIWTNPNEIPNNGIDDDNNGFVDDVHGWDFLQHDNVPSDDYWHGTHCAGILGASGNNGIGIAGVSWQVKLLPLKFLNSSGNGTTSNAIAAITYATRAGVAFTSNSYAINGEGYSQLMKDAIDSADAAGILFIASTGNQSLNIENTPVYPASYTSSNIIAVASTNRTDELSSFSNYGALNADLAAPGSDIYSTIPGGGYQFNSGTSMAAPHVTGVCALLKTLHPNLTHTAIKNLILGSVDVLPSLSGKVATSGRLNAFAALLASSDILVSRGSDFSVTSLVGQLPSPSSKTFTLTNHQNIPADWTASVNRAWVSLSPSSGTLAPGASVDVVLSFNSSATEMLAGDHTGIVTFTSISTGRTHLRNFAVTVSPPALYSYNLDTDPGWPRTGAWAYGVPSGQGGTSGGRPDPTSGATGTSVFGINLSGNYSTTVGPPQYLTAGPFNLTGYHAAKLRFKRWLNTDYQPWVYATIQLSTNGTTWQSVWDNGTKSITDSNWTTVTYDIAALADAKSQVYIRWGHQVAEMYSIPFSGWNIDDIEILGIPDRQMRLTLPPSVTEGGPSGTAKITIVPVSASNITVSLTTDRPAEVTFPASVTIPAGSEEVTFQITAMDDSAIDGTQLVTLTASAPLFTPQTASLHVHDNESGNLTISLPNQLMEGVGILPDAAELHLQSPASADVIVSLTSSAPTRLVVPASITIPMGSTSITFPLHVLDDTIIDTTQTVTVTATVVNWPNATASVNITDNESRQLTVLLPAIRLESSGNIIDAGTIQLAGKAKEDLLITLQSSSPSDLIVPETITIPAGAGSAAFNLTFQDNDLVDGPRIVQISASAATFITGNASITISDNETPALPSNPFPAHQFATTHPDSNLDWQTEPHSGGTPESYDVYFSTSPELNSGNLIGTTQISYWTLPRLIPGTTYYWQIVSRIDPQTRAGPIWTFTVPDVGPVKRFLWDSLPASIPVDESLPVRIHALDEFDNPVTSFTERVSLSAYIPAPETSTGTGSALSSTLLGTFYQKTRTQAIYTPAEVGPNGRLTAMAINTSNLPGQAMENFTVRLKHTSQTSYTGTPSWNNTDFTTVYQGTASPTSTGWFWITFTTPFIYNGASHLLVDISFSNTSFSTNGQCLVTPRSAARAISYQADSNTFGNPLTWNNTTPLPNPSNDLPNLRFKRQDTSVDLSPAIIDDFENGEWNGTITIAEPGRNIHIRATLAQSPDSSIFGISSPIDAVLIDAFALDSEPAFTGGLTNKITWEPLGADHEYEVQCSSDENFSSFVTSGFIAATEYTFTNLSDGSTYYYRGRARGNGSGMTGNWSPTISSTQDATPPTISLTPPSGTITTQNQITLKSIGTDSSGIASLTIDGVAASSLETESQWTQTLSNLPNGTRTVTVTATDNAVPPNSYSETWTITRIANPHGDSDGNGVPSLLEYALNTSGTKALTHMPSVSIETDQEDNERYITMTYRRRIGQPALSYLVEVSEDLKNWTSAGSSEQLISVTPTGDDITENVRLRLLPALQSGQVFVRLRVGIVEFAE